MAWPFKRRGPVLHVASDEGDGPVVVLIHGIASSSVTFQELVPLLTEHHRVIALDLLGFGESVAPAKTQFTLAEHVDALDATIRSLKLRAPFELVGHSLGALIASRYAAEHAEGVAKLILVSPPIYMRPESFSSPVDRAAMGIYLKVYEYLRTNKAFTIRAAKELDRFSPIRNVLQVSEQNWRAFVLSLQNAIESQSTVSDIARVEVPVEIVYGTLDPFLMPGGIQIVSTMRHVTISKVEANDHLLRKRLAKAVAVAVG